MRWSAQQVVENGVGAAPVLPGPSGVRHTVPPSGSAVHGLAARPVPHRVPGPSPVPTRWTAEPDPEPDTGHGHGCSHACVHCLAGPTRVLLPDGRTRPISELRPGDAVVGTERLHGQRRYVRTTVLAHWSTTRPAHRVRLVDGTEIVASGEHRLLTDTGWRHVTGGWCRSGRRPRLGAGSGLLGPGECAPARPHSSAYRQGYLCGIARADAPRGPFPSPQLELEALGRAHHFLALAGRPAPSLSPVGHGEPGRVPPPSGRGGIAPIAEVVRWPVRPGEDWCAGFLAGAADACGSVLRGELRIAHADEEIVGRVAGALHRLGFRFAVEAGGAERVVRLLGGPESFVRLLRTVDPSVSRLRDLAGAPVLGGAERRVRSVEPLGVALPMYDITTGTGDFVAEGVVSHNCVRYSPVPASLDSIAIAQRSFDCLNG